MHSETWEGPSVEQVDAAISDGDYIKALEFLLEAMMKAAVVPLRAEGFSASLDEQGRFVVNRATVLGEPSEKAAAALSVISDASRIANLVHALLDELGDDQPAAVELIATTLVTSMRLGLSSSLIWGAHSDVFSIADWFSQIRASQRAGQARGAASRVETWHSDAIARARALCSQDASSSNEKLAAEIGDFVANAPAHRQILVWVARWRRDGTLPAKVKRSSQVH